MDSDNALLSIARKQFHADLLEKKILTISDNGIPSNADKSSTASVTISSNIAKQLASRTGQRLAGQTSGSEFENVIESYIKDTFLNLPHIRPGKWEVRKIATRSQLAIADYEQYEHLGTLQKAARENSELAAVLGNDYTISPDIIVFKNAMDDNEINIDQPIVDLSTATRATLRKMSGSKPFMHASISSKWTIRSDRSQNARSEALNLIRNRKGHLPHIVVVTAEPLPSRLSSIALGTGDIDCVYHFALTELIEAVKSTQSEEATNMLNIMINGKRLKDISDLPLDIAI